MTEKLDMEDLFEDFEKNSTGEDTVDLTEVRVPEDDFFEQPVEETEYPTYGNLPEMKFPSHTYKTAGGKTVEVYHETMGTLWAIRFKEGGQLPDELKSKYTSDSDACQAVEMYLAKQ